MQKMKRKIVSPSTSQSVESKKSKTDFKDFQQKMDDETRKKELKEKGENSEMQQKETEEKDKIKNKSKETEENPEHQTKTEEKVSPETTEIEKGNIENNLKETVEKPDMEADKKERENLEKQQKKKEEKEVNIKNNPKETQENLDMQLETDEKGENLEKQKEKEEKEKNHKNDPKEIKENPDMQMETDEDLKLQQEIQEKEKIARQEVDKLKKEAEARQLQKEKESVPVPKHEMPSLLSLDGYELKRIMKSGKMGTLFEAVNTTNNEKCTVVVYKPVKKRLSHLFKRQSTTLKILQGGPNIIKLHAWMDQPVRHAAAFIFEYFDHPSLADIQHNLSTTLSSEEIRYYSYELLKALNHCHRAGYMHHNLSLSNVLIDRDNKKLRLVDWFVARDSRRGCTYNVDVENKGFKAPELLLEQFLKDHLCYSCHRRWKSEHGHCRTERVYHLAQEYDKADMWSFGSILADMILLKGLFGNRHKSELRCIIGRLGTKQFIHYIEKNGFVDDFVNTMDNGMCVGKSCGGDYYRHPKECPFHTEYAPSRYRTEFEDFIRDRNKHLVSDAAFDLLDKLLCYDPVKRLTASEAMEDPYFHPEWQKNTNAADPDNVPTEKITRIDKVAEWLEKVNPTTPQQDGCVPPGPSGPGTTALVAMEHDGPVTPRPSDPAAVAPASREEKDSMTPANVTTEEKGSMAPAPSDPAATAPPPVQSGPVAVTTECFNNNTTTIIDETESKTAAPRIVPPKESADLMAVDTAGDKTESKTAAPRRSARISTTPETVPLKESAELMAVDTAADKTESKTAAPRRSARISTTPQTVPLKESAELMAVDHADKTESKTAVAGLSAEFVPPESGEADKPQDMEVD